MPYGAAGVVQELAQREQQIRSLEGLLDERGVGGDLLGPWSARPL
jgi:hypothetical protein